MAVSTSKFQVGDIIGWYFDAWEGYSDRSGGNYTRMIDVVCEGDGALWAYDVDVRNGCYLWRAEPYAKKIGQLPEDINLLCGRWNDEKGVRESLRLMVMQGLRWQ